MTLAHARVATVVQLDEWTHVSMCGELHAAQFATCSACPRMMQHFSSYKLELPGHIEKKLITLPPLSSCQVIYGTSDKAFRNLKKSANFMRLRLHDNLD